MREHHHCFLDYVSSDHDHHNGRQRNGKVLMHVMNYHSGYIAQYP